MKAISLWQPYAPLIAVGEKRIETRGRRTPYRGLVAIHAAKTWTVEQIETCRREPFRTVLARHKLVIGDAAHQSAMPFGAIVALARLVDVTHFGFDCPRSAGVVLANRAARQHEWAFGDYATGRWGWILEDVLPLVHPVPCRGMQATPFDVPNEVAAGVIAQVREAGILALGAATA